MKKPSYIDLFAGCGGLSLGLHNAGWKGIFAIEKSEDAFETLKFNLVNRQNHFDWPSWLPVTNHDINDILLNHNDNLLKLRDNVDLIVGGPPCQGFSMAGRRIETDSRNSLISTYIKFIRTVQPKIILFENVKGFTQQFVKHKSDGRRYSEIVRKGLERKGKDFIGYNVHGKLVDFSEYGVPQKRIRFILFGVRKDLPQKNDAPQTLFEMLRLDSEILLAENGLSRKATVGDAISDLLAENGLSVCPDSVGFKAGIYNSPKSSYQSFLRGGKRLLRKIPDSHRFANHKESTKKLFFDLLMNAPRGVRLEGDKKKIYNLKKRGITVMGGDIPSPTLTSHPDDYVHYREPRILTVREYARIQSFPDWYEFKKNYTTGGLRRRYEVPRYTQIGNAIPPLFAYQIGIQMKSYLTHE